MGYISLENNVLPWDDSTKGSKGDVALRWAPRGTSTSAADGDHQACVESVDAPPAMLAADGDRQACVESVDAPPAMPADLLWKPSQWTAFLS